MIAKSITNAAMPAPNHRLQQFRWLDRPEFHLDGWYGAVQAVQLVEGGYLVNVLVSPLVTSSLGASTTVLTAVREQYAVPADGKVAFMQPLDGVDAAPLSFVTD